MGAAFRLLLVGIPDSLHLAKFTAMLNGSGIDVHLFPTSSAPLHSEMGSLRFHDVVDSLSADRPTRDSLRPANLRRAIASRPWSNEASRARNLARVIEQIRPDLVHAHEVRQGGALAVEAKRIVGTGFPPLMVSSWGSDLSLYRNLPTEQTRLRRILAACDFFSAECARDLHLARELGFSGELLGPIPIAGGYDLTALQMLRAPGPTSARRSIALKGFQHWAGRARVGLRAIQLCGRSLEGYRIALYLADPETVRDARRICSEIGIELEIISTTVSPAPYEDILRMQGRSRIAIGLSIGDAISTSFLEAIMMGAFPIQSCTSCADEWIEDGVGGLIVPPEDPHAVAAAIRRVIEDDELVDRAAIINQRVVTERLSADVVRSQTLQLYEHVLSRAHCESFQNHGQ